MEENCKNKLIEFKYWSKYHFIALAVPICCMLTTYLQKPEMANYNEIINKKIEIFPYFFNIFISKLLSIFLVLLSKYKSQRKSTNEIALSQTKSMRRYHLVVNNKAQKIKALILMLFISILEIIFKIEGYLIIGEQNYIELKLGFLLLVPLLSIFILKKRLYKHHIFAFSTCIIAFILVCISSEFYDKKPTFKQQIRHLLFSIPLGLAFVLIKYLFEKTFVDAFTFLFFDGIFCLIIPFVSIGFISIFSGFDFFIENMKGIANLFNEKVIIYFFLVVIFSFCYHLTNALTIYIFNPSLMVMTDILSPIFRWVIEVFYYEEYKDKENNNFICIAIFKGLGFLIIIFSSIVFNELLILHFYGLDTNIEANIIKRANNELMECSEDTSSFSKDDDADTDKSVESELSIVL